MSNTSFNLNAKVIENYIIYVSNFSQNPALIAKTKVDIFNTAIASIGHYPIVTNILTEIMTASATISRSGANTFTFNTTNPDCSILETLPYSYLSSGLSLGLGNSGSNSYKDWIPFVVSGLGTTTIVTATLSVVASQNSTSTSVGAKIGCESSGNAISPTGVTVPDFSNTVNVQDNFNLGFFTFTLNICFALHIILHD